MKKIPILSVRLLQIEASHSPGQIKNALFNAKMLLSENKPDFAKTNINENLFHNNEIEYSGIQLGNHLGTQEWTAIGNTAVKTLKIWYKIFKKQNAPLLHNTVVIEESYCPQFLDYQKKYEIPLLLISDNIAKELNNINDKFARNDRLEKYLYGNLQRFFKHIGFMHDKSNNFLKINIIKSNMHHKAKQVYHKQKKTAFCLVFTCNFLLPQTLRLGQSTALGYGSTFHC